MENVGKGKITCDVILSNHKLKSFWHKNLLVVVNSMKPKTYSKLWVSIRYQRQRWKYKSVSYNVQPKAICGVDCVFWRSLQARFGMKEVWISGLFKHELGSHFCVYFRKTNYIHVPLLITGYFNAETAR